MKQNRFKQLLPRCEAGQLQLVSRALILQHRTDRSISEIECASLLYPLFVIVRTFQNLLIC